MKPTKEHYFLLILTVVALIVSAIQPFDYLTWFLEVLPVLIALPLIIATYTAFPLTPLLYRLIVIHALILILGGHYTYARVPLGFWMQDIFEFSRNHYDRIGHIAQGFVPAILIRELLLRTSPLKDGKWLFTIVTFACLGFSALYELIEWCAALISEEAAESFLALQGDVWDTQWDMFLALLGCLAAQLLLRNKHRKELAPYLNT